MTNGGYGRGLDYLREEREKESARGGGMMKLWIKGGQQASFWFITDVNDFRVPLIHIVPKTRRDGSPWQKDVACAKRRLDDDTPCRLCALRERGDETIKGPWTRWVGFVYVQDVVSRDKPKRPLGELETRQAGGKSVYVQHVNQTWLVVAKTDLQGQIEEAYFGDPMDPDNEDRDPTLLDRQYIITRAKGGRTSESLKSREPSDAPEDVVAARADAPDLDEVINKEFGDEMQGEKKRKPASGSGRREFEPDKIPTSADFDDDGDGFNFDDEDGDDDLGGFDDEDGASDDAETFNI